MFQRRRCSALRAQWFWRERRKPRATRTPPSQSSNGPPHYRTRWPTRSRLIGTTRSGNLWPQLYYRPAATPKPSNNLRARFAGHRPMVGRTTDWPNYINHAATRRRRARPKLSSPRPGSAIAICCSFQIFEARRGSDRSAVACRRHDAAEHERQFGGDVPHDTAEHRQPFVRDPARHAGDRNSGQRFAAIVVDHSRDAAQPHARFLVIDGITAPPDALELLEQFARPHDRLFRQPRHSLPADDGVDVLIGIGGEHRLADAG